MWKSSQKQRLLYRTSSASTCFPEVAQRFVSSVVSAPNVDRAVPLRLARASHGRVRASVRQELRQDALESIYHGCLVTSTLKLSAGLRRRARNALRSVCAILNRDACDHLLQHRSPVEEQLMTKASRLWRLAASGPSTRRRSSRYLKRRQHCRSALLIDFRPLTTRLTAGLKRLVHPDLFMAQRRRITDGVGAEIRVGCVIRTSR